MGLAYDYSFGQTPLDEEEKEGLRIKTISSKAELNEFEQLNIEEAIQWVYGKQFNFRQVLCEQFVCNLHKRMFGNVWTWAGRFRTSEKNLGIKPFHIPIALKTLYEDAIFWMEHTTFTPDEIAVRFKHRIVSIHCFSNGNGRHSRLMADIIIEKIFKLPVFNWGTASYQSTQKLRAAYLRAVKAADKGEFSLLLAFARS